MSKEDVMLAAQRPPPTNLRASSKSVTERQAPKGRLLFGREARYACLLLASSAHLPNPNNLHRDSAALAGQRVGLIVNFYSHHFFCITRRHLGRCGARSILFVHRDYPIILFSFIPGPITTFLFFCRRRWLPPINMVSTTTIRTQSWVGRGLRSSQIPVLQHFI